MKTTIQELLSNAGYEGANLSNRNRNVRSFNSVLKNLDIEVFLCEKGKVWVTESGFKYNVKFKLGSFASRWKTNDFGEYNLLKLMGQFLKREEVKSVIYSEVEVPCKCGKCNGAGFLEQFYYYAEGVCFDCMGVGVTGKLIVQKVNKPRPMTPLKFIRQYYISELYSEVFPQNVNDHIDIIGFKGHPTAEVYLSKKDDMFYIHQSSCMANSWYAIPENEFEKFSKAYNKVFQGMHSRIKLESIIINK